MARVCCSRRGLASAVILVLIAGALLAVSVRDPLCLVRVGQRLRRARSIRRINAFLEGQLGGLELSRCRIHVDSASAPVMDSVTIENVGRGPVRNFWLWIEGRPNYYNLRTLNRSVMREAMSEREKALAVFEFFRDLPRFPLSGGPHPADPIRAFAVNGYGWSDTKARNAAAMLELEGIRVRPAVLPGKHVANEFYDSRARKWCYVDYDLLRYFTDEAGRLLSYRELAERARARTELRDDEYFGLFYEEDGTVPLPRRRRDYGGVLESTIEGLEADGRPYRETVSFYNHSMRFTLRPGETVRLSWKRGGRYYGQPCPVPMEDPTPRSARFGGVLFSNSEIVWRPDPPRLNAFLSRGEGLDEATGVTGEREGEARSLIFPYASPYVIVDAALELDVRAEGPVRLCYRKRPGRHRFYRMQRQAIAGPLALGPDWKPLWQHSGSYAGTICLSRLFCHDGNRAGGIPHYEGSLKLEFAAPATVHCLALRTTIQTSLFGLRSLALGAGDNIVNFYGPPLGEVSYRSERGVTFATAENEYLKVTFSYRAAGGSAGSPSREGAQ